MNNTGELGKTGTRFKLSNPPSFNKTSTLYRIKKSQTDASRKEKKRRIEDSNQGGRGLEDTLTVTAKPIGRSQPEGQKNIDIHIGNVNTYNIYFTGDQKQSVLQSQTPKINRTASSPDNANIQTSENKRAKRYHRPSKPQNKVSAGLGTKAQPLAAVTIDSKGVFKIAKVKRNNLILKDDLTDETSLPTVLQKPASSKYKSYGCDSKKVKRASEDDSPALRQPSPMENRLRLTADRFRKY